MIAGDAAFLARGRLVRQRLGGAMRQAGVLAAAALIALTENVGDLERDHALARSLAATVDAFEGLDSAPSEVDTNIVMVHFDHPNQDAESLRVALAAGGVGSLTFGSALRFVTHRDVGEGDVAHLRQVLTRLWS